MTPKAKKIRDVTVSLSISVTAVLTIVGGIIEHSPHLFDTVYIGRWLAAITVAILVVGAGLVIVGLKFRDTFGEFGETVVRGIHSDRQHQHHYRDLLEEQTRLRRVIEQLNLERLAAGQPPILHDHERSA
jgi:hypothetical protein